MTQQKRVARQRPEAGVVRAEIAARFGMSETEILHYQGERGISDSALRTPRWRDQLEQYVDRCVRGTAEPLIVGGAFVWRYTKLSIASRGFATNAPLRRAAERIALAANAALERSSHVIFGPTLGVTYDRCTVILAAQGIDALIVTAYAHDPTPSQHFLHVAHRVREVVEFSMRLREIA